MKPSSSAGVSAASPAAAWAASSSTMRSSAPSRSSSCTTCAEPYTLVVFGYAASKLATASSIVFGSVQNSTACSRRNCWPGMPASSFSMRSVRTTAPREAPRSCRHRGWAAGNPPRHRPARRRPGSGRPGDRNRHRSRIHQHRRYLSVLSSFQNHRSGKVSEGSRGRQTVGATNSKTRTAPSSALVRRVGRGRSTSSVSDANSDGVTRGSARRRARTRARSAPSRTRCL